MLFSRFVNPLRYSNGIHLGTRIVQISEMAQLSVG